MPRIKPGAAGWEASVLPLCYWAFPPLWQKLTFITPLTIGPIHSKTLWSPGDIKSNNEIGSEFDNVRWNHLSRRWGHHRPPVIKNQSDFNGTKMSRRMEESFEAPKNLGPFIRSDWFCQDRFPGFSESRVEGQRLKRIKQRSWVRILPFIFPNRLLITKVSQGSASLLMMWNSLKHELLAVLHKSEQAKMGTDWIAQPATLGSHLGSVMVLSNWLWLKTYVTCYWTSQLQVSCSVLSNFGKNFWHRNHHKNQLFFLQRVCSESNHHCKTSHSLNMWEIWHELNKKSTRVVV